MKEKILKVFDTFIDCMEKDDYTDAEKIFDENIVFESTHIGDFSGKEDVIEALKWKGHDINYTKIRVFNLVTKFDSEKCIQSSNLCCRYGYIKDNFIHMFDSGFLTSLTYKRSGDEWKISKIKMYMTFENGNSLLVENWWKLIDYDLMGGFSKIPIDVNEDSPWHGLSVFDDEKERTDEEEIKELFYRYNWALDIGDLDMLSDIVIKNFNVPVLEFGNFERWVEWFKEKRAKEACWSHIASFRTLDIDERTQSAVATIYRYEPHRIGTKKTHYKTLDDIWYSNLWTIYFGKEDGKWKMASFRFERELYLVKNDSRRYY